MTGSLQIKDNKYYIVLNSYASGKRRQKWIRTDLPVKGNKRRAEQLLRQTIQAYERQQGIIPSDVSFADFIRTWLAQVKRRVDEVTYQGYESLANSHILPYFDASGLKLQQVTRQLLQDYMDEKAAHGRKDGKGGLSPRSLRLHKNILYQALTEAVKAGLLSANPCEYIDLPSVPRHEAHFYTAEQVQTLLDSIRDDPLFPLVKITAIYGLRRSELLGLQWDSIDFESGTLTIRHTVSKVTKPVEKDKTKNASSYRQTHRHAQQNGHRDVDKTEQRGTFPLHHAHKGGEQHNDVHVIYRCPCKDQLRNALFYAVALIHEPDHPRHHHRRGNCRQHSTQDCRL